VKALKALDLCLLMNLFLNFSELDFLFNVLMKLFVFCIISTKMSKSNNIPPLHTACCSFSFNQLI
jgi:hypothetical protein